MKSCLFNLVSIVTVTSYRSPVFEHFHLLIRGCGLPDFTHLDTFDVATIVHNLTSSLSSLLARRACYVESRVCGYEFCIGYHG